jgi:hypothetical protein
LQETTTIGYVIIPKIHLRFIKDLKDELPLLRAFKGIAKAVGYLWMELKEMLAAPWWNLHCSHLHAVVSIGLQMEFTENMGLPWWNPLRSQAIPDGIYPAAIYMLLIPYGYQWLESTDKMDYPG